jgi:hypothetical protein
MHVLLRKRNSEANLLKACLISSGNGADKESRRGMHIEANAPARLACVGGKNSRSIAPRRTACSKGRPSIMVPWNAARVGRVVDRPDTPLGVILERMAYFALDHAGMLFRTVGSLWGPNFRTFPFGPPF